MFLTTPIDIPKAGFEIEAGRRVMLVGSCFADEVGAKMLQGGFDALVNPFGTLYNPASIAAALLRAISERELPAEPSRDDSDAVFQDPRDGLWHSWMHHSRFSAATYCELARRVNAATMQTCEFLRRADVLIVTLGTAIVYRLRDTGMLVANCHKQPDALFDRQRLTACDIADQWQMLLTLLASVNPQLRVIFTVSPIRHKRDGMHVNQISKGILLQAVDEIISSQQPAAAPLYFPAYEIMLDELRDYRFYADDMIHPSPLAVEYIWQRFQDTYFSAKTKDTVAKAAKEHKRAQHRSIIG